MKLVKLKINKNSDSNFFVIIQNNVKLKLFSFSFQIFIGLSLIAFLLTSCGGETKELVQSPKVNHTQKTITVKESIAISQLWTKDESYKIKRFVERRGWNAKRTETGMYYHIYVSNKEGVKAKAGDIASIKFKVRLLNADTTLCYSSVKGKTEDIMIEMDNVESGLHEALTYLREGEKAYVILPHYLAHGLAGDLDKIPPLSPVLYEINLVQLK